MSVSQLLNACESGDLETITSILNPTAAPSSSSSSSSSTATTTTAQTASLQHTKDDSDEESDDDEEFAPDGALPMGPFYGHGALKPSTESRDRWKITPLGAAIMGHQLPAIQLLLSLGANVNGVIEHSSLLHYACTIGGIGGDPSRAFAAACVAQLLTAGARTDALDEFDRTPLHIAGASGLHESIPLLLAAAAGTSHHVVDHQDNRGQTALHVAARNGHHTTVSALLAGNADKDITDHRGRTAAHHAAEVHDAVGMALCASEDPHIVDGLGRTANAIVQALEGESTDGSAGTDGPRRKPTLVVFPHPCVEHKTAISIARGKMDPPPENEQRIHVLVDANIGTLRAAEFNHRVVWDEASPRASLADILRVHDHLYVNMVKTRCESCEPAENTQVSEAARMAHLDMDTVMSRESYEAAMYAAGAACRAVDGIMAGECQNAFCVVRPPGHHAGPRGQVTAMDDPDSGSHGFCLFNNIAVGAAYARHMYRHQGIQRVAILDFDVHHGNGTEALVRNLEPTTVTNTFPTLFGDVTLESPSYKPWLDETDSDNVLFVSTHGYGHGFYPSTGRTGADRPVFNVGWPLCKDKNQARRDWRTAWRNAVMPALKDFNPDMIFLSCGVDGHRKDEMNHGFVCLQETDFEWLTEQVVEVANVHCQGRIVSCLEGGYRIHGNAVSAFARSVASHVRGLASPGVFCTSGKRVAFDAQVDAEVAARIEEEQRKLAEARAILEEKELEELRARLAEEEAKQLAILEAEASGMPMVEEEEVPPAPEAPSTSSSSSSSSSTQGGRRRRGSAAKVDYVALMAKMNAEKIMREKQASKE